MGWQSHLEVKRELKTGDIGGWYVFILINDRLKRKFSHSIYGARYRGVCTHLSCLRMERMMELGDTEKVKPDASAAA